MPELPEVETVRRGLVPVMEGAVVERLEARRADLRWPLPERFAERMKSRKIERLRRRAKYLLADLAGGETLIMHLGMSGSFRVLLGNEETSPGEFMYPRAKASNHDHVVFHMQPRATVTFNDPRRFGAMLIGETARLDEHALFKGLGPEPLSDELNVAYLADTCAGRKTSLKAALLDQRVVAGLGNIYVSEALHLAHLSPKKAAGILADRKGAPADAAKRLVPAIKKVITAAIEAGGSSLRDHRKTDGELGMFQHRFRVYDRDGAKCPTRGCKGKIRAIVQNARSTYYCPACQR
ncbi:MAG: bifunctional DNA-formamidopyrimidine glycosylase/DNA-(apurinic or apyrimidinic site) lyase [Xanthobacteraceae bacterium]|nr:bifunctional DNA-formamidopyrimidine glycosylase/DNA-(apurinic or apyrimidinic site) lyase [Xanthobacteraceae bacterium]